MGPFTCKSCAGGTVAPTRLSGNETPHLGDNAETLDTARGYVSAKTTYVYIYINGTCDCIGRRHQSMTSIKVQLTKVGGEWLTGIQSARPSLETSKSDSCFA